MKVVGIALVLLGWTSPSVAQLQGMFAADVNDLSLLSESHFTALQHPSFPLHSVRIKKTSVCDERANSYTGYIDFGARHLFFYFFESRNDPDKDDVIFWTNGGPGCSSSVGLFMELGPCKISDATGPKVHPESWNSNANIFFVDQPIGVGFSYADYGETVISTEEAAKDIAAFVAIFFHSFSKFQGRAFHMAGESFGGRYIPLFATAVYDQNVELVKAGFVPVNLSSIMIGNGLPNYYSMIPSMYAMLCTSTSIAPVLSIETCVKMKQALPRCQKWFKESCVDQFDLISCKAAHTFCEHWLYGSLAATNINPYDLTKRCEGDAIETFCYPTTKHISEYLSQPEVRKNLGVDPSLPSNFSFCQPQIFTDFTARVDEAHPTHLNIAALLERGIRTLIYTGKLDPICNFIGNEKWMQELEWSGHDEFAGQPMEDWFVDGEVAGHTRSARGLTYASVDRAGHMVPFDKPQEALYLVNKWLERGELAKP